MRKKALYLCILLFVFFSYESRAQNTYLFLGYGLGFTKLTDLNGIIDKYNYDRPYLSKEMKNFHNLDGFSMSGGILFWGMDLGMGFTIRNKKHHAIGVYNGVELRRDMKVKHNNLSINIGFGKADDASFFVGAITEFGNFKILTRSAEPDEIRSTDWKELEESIYAGAGLYFRFLLGNPGIALEPYIVWPLFEINIGDVYDYFNNSSGTYYTESQMVKPRVIGLKMSVGIVGG